MANAEVLKYFDKGARIQVIADASPVVLGAVLVQEKDSELRVMFHTQVEPCLRWNAVTAN